MMVVNLQEPNSLPSLFRDGLKNYDRHFMRELFLENVKEIPGISRLIKEINEFCNENMVVGFHYTRAIPQDLLTQGLRIRSEEEMRAEFISRFGHMFTTHEIEAIKAAWARYFDVGMTRTRDNRIFFNFTMDALNDGGASPLFE